MALKFIYTKLNGYDKTHSQFPLDFCGVFSDGQDKFPIFLPLQGEIVFEFSSPKNSIKEADAAFLNHIQAKKMPSDVSVTLEI